MDYRKQVYKMVEKIPQGKVVTYGVIARSLSSNLRKKITPRMVGRALHENKNTQIVPCHRVVNREGYVASNFAFGGARAQKELLVKETVPFKNDFCVDLERAMWDITL